MKRLNILIIFVISFSVMTLSQKNLQKIKITDDLEYVKISDNSYFVVSYGIIEGYGRIPANSYVYINKKKAFLFDTPINDDLTKDLVNWIQDSLKAKVVGFAPNHWHKDCIGGLNYIHKLGIKSYAGELTRKITKEKKLPIPKIGFKDSLILNLNGEKIILRYLGAGHSTDNISVWVPSEKVLFGGCMVKDMSAKTLGNLSDADVNEWPNTIKKLMDVYPYAETIIPGHGDFGGKELLNHTLELLKNHK
jgi:metallo-beta-lactamase class B